MLIAISFGWFMLASVLAVVDGFPVSAAPFSDTSLIGLIVTELVLGALALGYLRYRGYALRELLPRPDWRGCLEGALLCGAGIAACTVVDALLPSRSGAVEPVAQMLANARPTLIVVLAVSVLNGLYEETFLLGYLVRGFASSGASFAVGLSVLVRLLYHLYQGPAGAVSVVVFGIVLGAAYWRTRRLWPAVVAHTLADILGLS
ncbi:CPBP family intramembrane metalloprotease [Massilia sp. IC2-278]|uniref:CPBP family intramembrane glutamic endopeptidase n=1 Tax=Massilia sp. IC2-278 TaxID=2887200 RepID=UPI001E4FDC35|nr:CPBP family intramembrane glutamic endopeptidase [Massilia sp. IC2-278]MCC2962471.1 CPBP family intramembrane metalloprotease [Massilia sp. IC2-278]